MKITKLPDQKNGPRLSVMLNESIAFESSGAWLMGVIRMVPWDEVMNQDTVQVASRTTSKRYVRAEKRHSRQRKKSHKRSGNS